MIDDAALQRRGLPERWIDELLPEDLDWEDLVRAYPIPCLVAATAFGFVVGRSHGPAIVDALVSFAGSRAGQALEGVLDEIEPGDREDGS